MAFVAGGYPLYYDAVNEKGLGDVYKRQVTANTPKAIADTTIKTLNAPVLLSKMRAAIRSQTECTAADKIYEWIDSHAK